MSRSIPEDLVLSYKEAVKIFDYNSNSGVILNKIPRGSRAKKGDVSGALHNCGYRWTNLNKQFLLLHRVAWLIYYGVYPKGEIDHINGDRADNRIENLRDVTHQANGRNQRMHVTNTSGITGVHYVKNRNEWRAYININESIINLGQFKDKFEAICARKAEEYKQGFHANHGIKKPACK